MFSRVLIEVDRSCAYIHAEITCADLRLSYPDIITVTLYKQRFFYAGKQKPSYVSNANINLASDRRSSPSIGSVDNEQSEGSEGRRISISFSGIIWDCLERGLRNNGLERVFIRAKDLLHVGISVMSALL